MFFKQAFVATNLNSIEDKNSLEKEVKKRKLDKSAKVTVIIGLFDHEAIL